MDETTTPLGPKRVLAIVVFIVALGLVSWGLYSSTRDRGEEEVNPTPNQREEEQVFPEIVNVKHQYKDGTHTYVGEFQLPTPCHQLSHEVKMDANASGSVSISFRSRASGEVCVQVITAKEFHVSFAGPLRVTLTVTRDGNPVTFNLFDVPVGEDIDDFNIYTKG